MLRPDLKALGDAVILAVRGYVDAIAGPLATRLALFEVALKTLPKPEPGDKGDRGDDAPPVDVARLAAEVFALVPVPKNGDPGEPGKSVTVDDVAPIIREAVTREVAARPAAEKADPAEIAGILLRAIAEMPKPEPVDIAAVAAQAFALVPVPKNGEPGEPGKSVTLDDVRPLVLEAVAALPVPKGADPAVIAELVAQAVAKMPKPRDGDDFDPDLLRSEVARAVSALPLAEPGKDADPVLIEQSIQVEAAATRDELMKALETVTAQAKAEILAHADTLIAELPKLDPAAISKDVLDKVVDLFHAIPAPKNGEPGKDADPEFIRAEVTRLFAELPPAEPGKDADPAVIASMLAQAVAAIELPAPKEIDPAAIRAEVERVVAELPPQKGKDADPVDVAEVANQVLALVVPKIPPPKEVDPELLRAEIAKAFAEIPKPRDGEDVPLEVTQALIVGEVAKVFAAMPKPTNGDPGRDALQLDILPMIDETKSYPRNSLAWHRGGYWHAVKNTNGMDGWVCQMKGIVEETEELQADERTTVRTTTYSDGSTWVRESKSTAVIWRGIWKDTDPYERFDSATRDGSTWVLMADKQTGKPGDEHSGWVLSSKRGQDGKSIRGDKGDRGPPGKNGTDLTQLGGTGTRY